MPKSFGNILLALYPNPTLGSLNHPWVDNLLGKVVRRPGILGFYPGLGFLKEVTLFPSPGNLTLIIPFLGVHWFFQGVKGRENQLGGAPFLLSTVFFSLPFFPPRGLKVFGGFPTRGGNLASCLYPTGKFVGPQFFFGPGFLFCPFIGGSL